MTDLAVGNAVVDIQFKIQGRETRPQMLQVAGPNEIVILLVFDVKIGEIRGRRAGPEKFVRPGKRAGTDAAFGRSFVCMCVGAGTR